MTRRLLAFTCFISCLYSCGNESKTEVIDSKEIIPQSEKYRDETNIKTPTADSMDNSFNLQLAKELGLSIKAFQQVEEPFFLDRFTPKSLKKWQIDLETEKAFVGQWCYKDSVATMNAFYNWLDCFGSRCKSFKLMDKVNFQTDNFLVFLNDTSITYITSSFKLDKEMWRLYFKKQNSFEELDLIMYQTRRGKVNWLSYRETQKKDNFDYQPYATNK